MTNIKRNLLALIGLLIPLVAPAQTYNRFSPADGVLVGDPDTYVTTAATAADIVALWAACSANEYLNQSGTCSLVSLAASVTGTLPVANGGTNLTASSDDNVMVGNGTTWQSKALTDCDAASSAVTYDTTSNAWGCHTISAGATLADPTATIGLSATNGVATTAMRSDAAPALSQAISPTWTGTHLFRGGLSRGGTTAQVTVGLTSGLPLVGLTNSNGGTNEKTVELFVSNSGGLTIQNLNEAGSTGRNILATTRSGVAVSNISIGNATDNPSTSVLGTGTTNVAGAVTVGSPTGGSQGTGTVNATGLYINGVSVTGGATTSGTFSPTFGGFSSAPSCTMKWRLTGSQVSLFVDSGGTCTGTSNATTMTITNLPTSIRPNTNASVMGLCSDNGQDRQCLLVAQSSGTATFYVGDPFSSTGFTASGSKGITTSVYIYDLRN